MKELGIFILGALALALVQLCVAMFRRRGDNRPAADRIADRLFAIDRWVHCCARGFDAAVTSFRMEREAWSEEPTCHAVAPPAETCELRLAGSAE